jgi:uncharacterized protein
MDEEDDQPRGRNRAGDSEPDCLLPYDTWTESALRQVVASALRHVGREGLPGEHHFYLTFRTDHPRTVIPQRIRTQYPHEINVILQHQFWDLKVDDEEGRFSVGVSFGGVPCTLVVPFDAVTYFADPHVRLEMRFQPSGMPETGQDNDAVPASAEADAASAEGEPGKPDDVPAEEPATSQVVSLDAFRRRSTPKD